MAADTLSPEARNSPPRAQVSLQIGWLLTLSRTPVYPATNTPSSAPMTMKTRPIGPPIRSAMRAASG